MRTIDADALIKTIGSHCYPVRQENNSIEPGMTQIGILQAIQEQPTIEERKTGKWILWNYPGAECARCSVCGEEYDQIDLYIGGNDYPKFCPNCGADMRGESDDIPIEYFESGGI